MVLKSTQVAISSLRLRGFLTDLLAATFAFRNLFSTKQPSKSCQIITCTCVYLHTWACMYVGTCVVYVCAHVIWGRGCVALHPSAKGSPRSHTLRLWHYSLLSLRGDFGTSFESSSEIICLQTARGFICPLNHAETFMCQALSCARSLRLSDGQRRTSPPTWFTKASCSTEL